LSISLEQHIVQLLEKGDTTAINLSDIPIKDINYVFHNLVWEDSDGCPAV